MEISRSFSIGACFSPPFSNNIRELGEYLMGIVVQKFGGTSVATVENIRRATGWTD